MGYLSSCNDYFSSFCCYSNSAIDVHNFALPDNPDSLENTIQYRRVASPMDEVIARIDSLNITVLKMSERGITKQNFDLKEMAEQYGMKSSNATTFLKNVLTYSPSVNLVLKEIEKASENNVLDKMADDSALSRNPGLFSRTGSFERAMAAIIQGISISVKVVNGGRDSYLSIFSKDCVSSTDNETSVSLRGVDSSLSPRNCNYNYIQPGNSLASARTQLENFGSRKKTEAFVVDPKDNQVSGISVKILGTIAAGSANVVQLGWLEANRDYGLAGQFVTFRACKSEMKTFSGKILAEKDGGFLTNKSVNERKQTEKLVKEEDAKNLATTLKINKRMIFFYDQLKNNSEGDELELIEKPDVLVKIESKDHLLAMRELAVDGDLFCVNTSNKMKNVDEFNKIPRSLVIPLFKQLLVYKKSGIAMGDVKPGNINIHRDVKGNLVPKYSDIDGGICSKYSTDLLFDLWVSLKESLGDSYVSSGFLIDHIINNRDEYDPFFEEEEGVAKKTFIEFREEFLNVIILATTLKYTFANQEDLYLSFMEDNAFILRAAFTKSERKLTQNMLLRDDSVQNFEDLPKQDLFKGCKAGIEEGVQVIVDSVQKLDIKATAMSLVRTFLGKNIIKKYELFYLAEFGRDGSLNDYSFDLSEALKDKQESLPEEKRLSADCVDLIVDMLAGEFTLDELGMVKMQSVIEMMEEQI
jgi:hypothetical protein